MECGSSSIWLPALQAKDRVVFIFVNLPALTVPGTLWVLSHDLFCCVIVSMLNNMEDSLFPIFVHLWQTQLIAHLTAITAPSPFILAGETLVLFWASLSTKLHAQETTPLCWRGESIMVTGPINLCSPIPLACGPNPTEEVSEHLVSVEKSIFFS